MKFKKLLTVLLLGILLFTFPSMASAQEINHRNANQTISSETSITPLSDVIITKYRIYNGKRQYRRWNESRQCWVDAYWITIK